MGTVWQIKDRHDAILAIKFCQSPQPESRDRFRREVRAMRTLTHPNVVRIVDADLLADPPYFVMPHSPLGIAEACEQLDESGRLDLFLQVCAGVRALHAAGVIHRDIKPDNMRMFDAQAAVTDLGLARFVSRDSTILTASKHILGTEWYLAPEQRAPGGSRDADERTDVYQLGRSLYQILTGEPPVLMNPAKVSPYLNLVIERAIKEHPDERYQTVAKLMDAVDTYLATKNPSIKAHDSLGACIASIKDQEKYGRYDPGELKRAVGMFLLPEILADLESWLQLFDDLPLTILGILPSVLDSSELAALLGKYRDAVASTIRSKRFEYAEAVARRVTSVLSNQNLGPATVSNSLESLLIAAVTLNRFSAMDQFNDLLRSIRDEGVAMAVAEMLGRRPEYEVIVDQIPTNQLHDVIASLRKNRGNSTWQD